MSQSYVTAGHAVACSRFLPAPLIQARAAVFDPLLCIDLNVTARRVLYGILTFVSIKNTIKAIFPRRDTLRAESLLQSDSPLYRGLRVLEEKGYISRDQKRNARNGKFYLSPIALTEKALANLALEKLIHSSPPANVADGHIKKELTKDLQSIQKTTGQAQNLPKNGIDPKTRLPNDLVVLLSKDVEKSAICWLMTQAKANGKRLGDMVATVSSNIDALRGREVVGYLKSLMDKNIDFAWTAKDKHRVASELASTQAARDKLDAIDERYEGFAVLSASGAVVGHYCAGGGPEAKGMIVGAKGSMPVNLRFAKEWAEGRYTLVPVAPRHRSRDFDDDDNEEF